MTEGVVYGIKIALATSAALIYITAINVLAGLLLTFLPSSPSGVLLEILRLVSVCLPFDAVTVFLAITECCTAITAFLIAQQVYKITMTTYNAS